MKKLKSIDLFAGIGGMRLAFEKACKELNIEPSLVWHAASLERIARAAKLTKSELDSPELRVWQVHTFQKNLSKFISENGINE